MTARAKPSYARKAQVERMISAARACGLDVVGFEALPDGTIRIMEKRSVPQQPANDFERYQDQL